MGDVEGMIYGVVRVKQGSKEKMPYLVEGPEHDMLQGKKTKEEFPT